MSEADFGSHIKRVLVIGASGFLGRHIVRELSGAGYEVYGLSRSASGDNAIHSAGGVAVRGELAQIEAVIPQVMANDAIIFAAQLMIDEERDAITGILRAIAGSQRTFIMTSGAGILARRTDGEACSERFAEDDPFEPSKYIGGRLDTERLVRVAGTSDRCRAMVIRPPMITGNGGCGQIRMFYQGARDSGYVGYVGAGLNAYSFVHVEDLAHLFALALVHGVTGALYHAASGEMCSKDIAEAVARDLDLPARSITIGEAIQRWGKFKALIGMAVCCRITCQRSLEDLGWRPKRTDLLADIGHPAYRAVA